jgi:hypothetical protein
MDGANTTKHLRFGGAECMRVHDGMLEMRCATAGEKQNGFYLFTVHVENVR